MLFNNFSTFWGLTTLPILVLSKYLHFGIEGHWRWGLTWLTLLTQMKWKTKAAASDFWCSHATLVHCVCGRRTTLSSTSASPFQDTFRRGNSALMWIFRSPKAHVSGLEAVFLGGFGTFEHQDPERSSGHYGYVLEKDAGTPTPFSLCLNHQLSSCVLPRGPTGMCLLLWTNAREPIIDQNPQHSKRALSLWIRRLSRSLGNDRKLAQTAFTANFLSLKTILHRTDFGRLFLVFYVRVWGAGLWSWSSPTQLVWLYGKPSGSTCFHPSRAFICGCWGSRFSSSASILLTEPSPLSWPLKFLRHAHNQLIYLSLNSSMIEKVLIK